MDRALFLRLLHAFVATTATVLAACGGAETGMDKGPIAHADSADVNQDTPATLAVLANDVPRNVALNPSSVAIKQQASHGSAAVNPDGSITYRPSEGIAGLRDHLRYSVRDMSGKESNIADVSIYINAAPLANNACWDTFQSVPLTAYLPASDAETPTRLIYAIDPDRSGTKGTATLLDMATGQFKYTPDPSRPRGRDSFLYHVTDPQGATAQGSVDIVIAPRVMPLGDSLTTGVMDGSTGLPVAEERVGYRGPLETLLTGNNFPFDFVGSQNFGSLAMGDPHNEGHGGWTAREVAYGRLGDGSDGIYAWLSRNPADSVLLHIGTNRLSTTTADDVAAILNEVDRWERDTGTPVSVLVARIIDQDPRNPAIAVFNDEVAAMVDSRAYNPNHPAYPDDVVIVDQYNALTYPADLSDALHPTNGGYAKMAQAWFEELSKQLDRCP